MYWTSTEKKQDPTKSELVVSINMEPVLWFFLDNTIAWKTSGIIVWHNLFFLFVISKLTKLGSDYN